MADRGRSIPLDPVEPPRTWLDDPGPVSGRSHGAHCRTRSALAEDLIAWLNECVDCGRAHEERVDSNGYTTTRSQVDGHPYTARAQLPTFDIFDLVREWADLP